ncbi:class I SAM-dependent methyltransferase [Modestobacter sp. VKM Ac-2977]|uniref:class I SAM-dependent methyltransferase n=1 Tax=Modestobacter sp. VKM Ac-2977 TaxID=3004131 RepID=UPI0022AA159C|nr:class I SAM-dependent methyltransferase [Modestobacter sp. VKM Ac-2977]MCZ2819883.1 class I SAM-dependent methyltransferase [Modestobacter sp. VKM Ac-2977]
MLDRSCGPGDWTALLHPWGAQVAGVGMAREFIARLQTSHPGPESELGSMTELDVPEQSVASIRSWYATIHLPPP